jgi:signal transduction histidine kinase
MALWLSVSIRWVQEFIEQNHRLTVPLSILLLVYAILLVMEFVFVSENSVWTHLYLLVQSCLVFTATLFYFELDFFAILFIPLSGQAVLNLPRKSARLWVGVLTVLTLIGEITQFGWPGAISFTFLYIAGIVFVALFSEITLQSEQARQRSDGLLKELREVHRRLQEYADQAQELAAARERNRLARDLHDSVAQTLYGLTLRSEAALRKLGQGDIESVAAYLQEFQESTHQSLRETRLLIYELRPDILREQGLRTALVSRLDFVEKRSGLEVTMDFDEVPDIPLNMEIALYRIAQEALNNVIKHAHASEVRVVLEQLPGLLRITVQDNGVGIQDLSFKKSSGLGFQSMRERVEEIGAKLEIKPAPDSGVCVVVEVPYD